MANRLFATKAHEAPIDIGVERGDRKQLACSRTFIRAVAHSESEVGSVDGAADVNGMLKVERCCDVVGHLASRGCGES